MSLNSNKAEDKPILARELKCASDWSPRCAPVSSVEQSGQLNVHQGFLSSLVASRRPLGPESQKSVWTVCVKLHPKTLA